MITPIQVLLLLILVFAISRVYLRTRDGSISSSAFLFWMGLFFVVGITVIDPSYTTVIADQFGTGRGVDIAIYLSIILLYYLVFRTSVMLENLRHELTKLVQALALKNYQLPESKNQNSTSKTATTNLKER